MATSPKKYYWLKLKTDFFREKEIKKLRRIAGGDTYTIIYLKIMLISLQEEGRLYYDGIEDSFAEELALEIDEDTDNVKITLMYLMKMGLLEEVSEHEMNLTRVGECIGKETAKAEIMRKKRERDKLLRLESGNNVTENGNNVTPLLPPVTFCYTEKEIEKEKELEIELEIEKEAETEAEKEKKNADLRSVCETVVSHLNARTGSKYRATSKETKKHIHARLSEGFTVQDFITVIDKKTEQWLHDPKMSEYLRPVTLFGTKFESYLNAPVNTKKTGRAGVEIAEASETDDILNGIL